MEVCSPWIDPSDLCCEGDNTVTDCNGVVTPLTYQWTDLQYAMAASNILYARTCYQYPGICTDSIWPCIDPCSGSHYPCVQCCSPSVIELPTNFSVISIIQITEDGVILDPSAYRLERGRFLVRLDGLKWQKNSFGIPGCGGVETIIEYTHGLMPPIELIQAASLLACSLKAACEGDACGLPANTKSRTSRGVEVELFSLVETLKSGYIGVPNIDMILYSYKDCGHADSFQDPLRFGIGWGNV